MHRQWTSNRQVNKSSLLLTGKSSLVRKLWHVIAKNAHILRQELLREALWYMLNGPNRDVTFRKLAQLVVSGIESNWLANEMASWMEEDGRNLVAATWGRKIVAGSQGPTATLTGMLSKDDYLILESFCILTLGLGLSTALFMLNVGFRVASKYMKHLCDYLSKHRAAFRAKHHGTT